MKRFVNRLPDPVAMMQSLIALPSISSAQPAIDQSNRAVAEQLAAWLEPLGFRCELLPLPLQPHKCNLVATLGRGSGGLVLSGHLDTVPYDEGAWTSDPFAGTVRDGRLYGLGSSDMKGFLALATTAAARFQPDQLKEPLILIGTADEETGMEGARMLLEAGRPRARHAVIGEPTGMRPIRAHKGILMEAIRVRGRAGHSSNPALGLNAIEGMAQVIDGLRGLQGELRERFNDPIFAVHHPTLNIGHICGGDAPNRIPALCDLHIDLRFLPGMSIEGLRERIHRAVETALAGTDYGLDVHPLFDGTPAHGCDAGAAICRAAERLTGHAAGTVDFATEAGYFGALGMETIIMGPGDIDCAHQPDEFLPLDRVEPTIDHLAALIHRFCVEPDDTATTIATEGSPA